VASRGSSFSKQRSHDFHRANDDQRGEKSQEHITENGTSPDPIDETRPDQTRSCLSQSILDRGEMESIDGPTVQLVKAVDFGTTTMVIQVARVPDCRCHFATPRCCAL
jgi:hypothetical protein